MQNISRAVHRRIDLASWVNLAGQVKIFALTINWLRFAMFGGLGNVRLARAHRKSRSDFEQQELSFRLR